MHSGIEWDHSERFIWDKSDLPKIKESFEQKISSAEYEKFINSLSSNDDSDTVACLYNSFFIKSCKQTVKTKFSRKLRKRKYKRLQFFDQECRTKRIAAIEAGARVVTDEDKENLVTKTKSYKACIQRKKRKKKYERRKKL